MWQPPSNFSNVVTTFNLSDVVIASSQVYFVVGFGQMEWFEAKEKGKVIDSKLMMVPDEYGRSLQLTNILSRLQEQLEQQTVVAQYFYLSSTAHPQLIIGYLAVIFIANYQCG